MSCVVGGKLGGLSGRCQEKKSFIGTRSLLNVPEWPNMRRIEKQPLTGNMEVIRRAGFKSSS